jgi:L-lactate dehydrogenase complex protein LldE
MTVALFVPCYIDQLYPQAAIAALRVLERLGVEVAVPQGAVCCGQPPASAGFERLGERPLRRFVETFEPHDRVVVLSGSCALHVHAHAGSLGRTGERVAERTVEFCAFLHDVIGVDAVAALRASFPRRVAVHIGCHGLRGLGLARPSELRLPPYDKIRALLGVVQGLTFAELRRPDECCGFGGTFSVTEPAVSVKMGRDRLRDFRGGGADVVVSTDVSCLLHLDGLVRREGLALPMLHVAEVLAGEAGAASRRGTTGASAAAANALPVVRP